MNWVLNWIMAEGARARGWCPGAWKERALPRNRFGWPPALFAVALLIVFAMPAGGATDFISGADFSLLTYFESQGIQYQTNGQVEDALTIMKDSGLNCVRLRLFTSSAAQASADPYNYINNLDYAVPLAVRVKNAGLRFLLDFHYSDTWADPGHQAKPAAWASLDFPSLVQQMHDYSSNCIVAFRTAGAMPDYVQVGNEITGGLLWPDGQVGTANDSVQWPKLAQLLNAAIQGIQDGSAGNPPKIMIHIDRGGDWNRTKWFFDNIRTQGVSYDLIGESYYPYWHGPWTNLNTCLRNAASRYGKPVVVAETDFPWAYSTNIYGIPATPDGQVSFAVVLAQIVKGIPSDMGGGIIWWGSEYQIPDANQAGFGTRSFFDSSGNVLPVAGAFGDMLAPLVLSPALSGSSLTLTWPLSGAGMTLTSSGYLGAAANWVAVSNAIQNVGTRFTTTVPVDSQAKFYRLKSN